MIHMQELIAKLILHEYLTLDSYMNNLPYILHRDQLDLLNIGA